MIVFTTFPKEEFTCKEILEWYRVRWQIELIFKKFKFLAQLGHLPKRDDESAKAWLYGKLFVALITQRLINNAIFFPHGDIRWKKYRTQSHWRDFAFMLHQTQRAIEPGLARDKFIQLRLSELSIGFYT